jgi:hypothetical protein
VQGKTLELHFFGDLGRKENPKLSKVGVTKYHQSSDLIGGMGESPPSIVVTHI